VEGVTLALDLAKRLDAGKSHIKGAFPTLANCTAGRFAVDSPSPPLATLRQ
jgi:hypothetical protein